MSDVVEHDEPVVEDAPAAAEAWSADGSITTSVDLSAGRDRHSPLADLLTWTPSRDELSVAAAAKADFAVNVLGEAILADVGCNVPVGVRLEGGEGVRISLWPLASTETPNEPEPEPEHAITDVHEAEAPSA